MRTKQQKALEQQQLVAINNALRAVDEANVLQEMADRCGVGCEQQRAAVSAMYEQMKMIKEVFFPGEK